MQKKKKKRLKEFIILLLLFIFQKTLSNLNFKCFVYKMFMKKKNRPVTIRAIGSTS